MLSESRRISGELSILPRMAVALVPARGRRWTSSGAVRRAFGTGLRGRTDSSPEKRRGLDGTLPHCSAPSFHPRLCHIIKKDAGAGLRTGSPRGLRARCCRASRLSASGPAFAPASLSLALRRRPCSPLSCRQGRPARASGNALSSPCSGKYQADFGF